MPTWNSRAERGWLDEFGFKTKQKIINKSFIWPSGGRRRSRWHRLKDLAMGKGPDIYVAFNANRTPGAPDGPSQRLWSRHFERETSPWVIWHDLDSYWGDWPYAGRRCAAKQYDFRSRRYRNMKPGMWSSANYIQRETVPTTVEEWLWGDLWSRYPDRMAATIDPRNFNEYTAAGMAGSGGYWHPRLGRQDMYWDEQGFPIHRF